MTNWSCDKDCRIVGELIISYLKYFQCGKLSSDQSLNAPAFSPCSGLSAPSHRRLLIRRHARDAHLVDSCAGAPGPAAFHSAEREENVKRSTDRILVTHVGSLVRPMSIRGVLSARDYGHPYDQAAYEKTLRREVAAIVRKQADVGIDIVSDGSARRAGSATLPSGSAASCIARSDPEITNTIRSI